MSWRPIEEEFYGSSDYEFFNKKSSERRILEEPAKFEFPVNPIKLEAAIGSDIFKKSTIEKELVHIMRSCAIKQQTEIILDLKKTLPQPLPDLVLDNYSGRPIILETDRFSVKKNEVDSDLEKIQERYLDENLPIEEKCRTFFYDVNGQGFY